MATDNYNKLTSITWQQLTQIVGHDFITQEKEQLEKYGQDETEDLLYIAEAVVKPQTVEQVAAIAKICNDNRIPLTTRGSRHRTQRWCPANKRRCFTEHGKIQQDLIRRRAQFTGYC